jgi:hypothetical protein
VPDLLRCIEGVIVERPLQLGVQLQLENEKHQLLVDQG